MTYTLTPVEFEIYDDTNDLAAKVTMFDGCVANIEIRLGPIVQSSLSQMKLEVDK